MVGVLLVQDTSTSPSPASDQAQAQAQTPSSPKPSAAPTAITVPSPAVVPKTESDPTTPGTKPASRSVQAQLTTGDADSIRRQREAAERLEQERKEKAETDKRLQELLEHSCALFFALLPSYGDMLCDCRALCL